MPNKGKQMFSHGHLMRDKRLVLDRIKLDCSNDSRLTFHFAHKSIIFLNFYAHSGLVVNIENDSRNAVLKYWIVA